MKRPINIQSETPQTEDRIPSMIPRLMQHQLLARDEERELARKAKAGDDEARRRLAESNLRLVCKIAGRYQASGISFEDLVQEGTIGLMRAIDRYDPEMGWKFSTYAVFWIRQAIGKAIILRSRVIRLPAHIFEAGKKVSKRRADFIARTGHLPTDEELANDLGISVDRLAAVNGVDQDCVSLETGRDESWDYTTVLEDETCESPEGEALKKFGVEELHRLLRRLPDRERTVLERRLGLAGVMPMAVLQELAIQLGVSKERVRQIETRAIRELRRIVSEGDTPSIEALLSQAE
ncbi:MAG: RNA polymerase sigma factor RpoD/SigA [Fimbriimonadales bacterium]